MGVFIPVFTVTAFWMIVGVGGPFIIPKGPNRGIIQTMVVLTACCCWLFWVLVYLHQLNPLIGPQLPVRTIRWISEKWGDANELIPP
ncbi:ATP synthase subunit H [Onchocerca flexuosa]|uniref:V-type proton ATPase subunit n=2 Tax=Onchocerca flexuosa TaxID=387005 RepID=A0A183HIH1_9BILA|nr:ATP synthase subunit H [Onchocerca flexuosa]VDO50221.1 unnamed protein product [Onchocerca flexuosa]